jgi:hypothetical protein
MCSLFPILTIHVHRVVSGRTLLEIYHRTSYNVNLQGISVGGATLQLPTSASGSGGSKGTTIIDSGTTLAYLPREVYRTLLAAVWEFLYQTIFCSEEQFVPAIANMMFS